MENSERIRQLEAEVERLKQRNYQLQMMQMTMMHQLSKLANASIETIVVGAPKCRMVMALPKTNNEMSKIMDVTADRGLMIYPYQDRYQIVTAGPLNRGLYMLAHVMRWAMNGEHASEFIRIQQDLNEATQHVSL